MVPVRLHLHNFLSYGDTTEPIELDGIHVACLCGPNGHGKSALLDAMTWALWGQARTPSADDLIRHNQTSMWVEFDFRLEGQLYRVVRRRTRGRTGQSDLQFQCRVGDGPDATWRPLTGQGIRNTQERINQVLRMDYETFINSAFILQGRADEFARKTPGERKRILGEILNLGVYDQLAELARARRQEAATRAQVAEGEIARIERELARLPELRARVDSLAAQQKEAAEGVARARAAHSEVMVEKTRLDACRLRREDLSRRIAAEEEEERRLRLELGEVLRQREQSRALLARSEEIRARARQLVEAREEQQRLFGALTAHQELQTERAEWERRLREARHRIEVQLAQARDRAREQHALAERLPELQAECADLERQVATLERLRQERTELESRIEALVAEAAAAEQEARRCGEELERTGERFELLKHARATCPVCEAELDETKRKELGWKLREERETLKKAQGAALQRLGEARRAAESARARRAELDRKLKVGEQVRDRFAQARQQMLRMEEARKAVAAELEQVAALERTLSEEAFAPEIRERLREVEARISAIGFDRARLEAVSQRVRELEGAERDALALDQVEARLPELETRIADLEAAIRSREAQLAEDRVAAAELDRELSRLPAVDAEAARLEQALHVAEQQEAALTRDLGAATQELERCQGMEPLLRERKAERDAALEDQSAYEELARAFGRNGLQALIIENALPELEAEANRLLHRMSDGQLSVRLNTQRELRAGGQAETLEIEISDSLGARRYELFSGGEAFRVNFALRIALSRLLARRAGARLETLVIDEGFGSQDQDGLQRLVEAIHAVQDDFTRILIITHLDDLKEAFPTRIEVTKGPGGSQVAIY